jgi:GT2 family glycosyltransferase
MIATRGGAPRLTRPDVPPPCGVAAVIVNFNAGCLLADCLGSILPQVEEVVLVDNASDPEGFEPVVAAFAAWPGLRVVPSPVNLGFAAGSNLGIAATTAPRVLLLNPDCVVAEGTVARLCAALDAAPRAGLAGGLLTDASGLEQGGGRRAVPTPWRSFVRAFGLSRWSHRWPKLFDDFHLHRQPLPAAPIEVEAISGACMLVTRAALDDVGPLDDGFFLHCEDLDYSMRARGRGWTILFVPDAPVVHHKGVCSRDRQLFVEWHKHKGMVRFYRKHFRHQYPAGLMAAVACGVWLRFSSIATRLLAARATAAVRSAWSHPAGRPVARPAAVLPLEMAPRPTAS